MLRWRWGFIKLIGSARKYIAIGTEFNRIGWPICIKCDVHLGLKSANRGQGLREGKLNIDSERSEGDFCGCETLSRYGQPRRVSPTQASPD